MPPVNTHTLQAFTPDGRKVEIGCVRSREAAVRLQTMLSAELGEEYTRFEIVELEPVPPTVRSVTHAELRRVG